MKLRAIGMKVRPSKQAKIGLPEKKAEPFYSSPEWRTLMDSIIKQRFGSKEQARCEHPQCLYSHRVGIRVSGDHVAELKDGGSPLDATNIMCVCGSCHTRKTAVARAGRYHRGVGKYPKPISGEYPQASHGEIFLGVVRTELRTNADFLDL